MRVVPLLFLLGCTQAPDVSGFYAVVYGEESLDVSDCQAVSKEVDSWWFSSWVDGDDESDQPSGTMEVIQDGRGVTFGFYECYIGGLLSGASDAGAAFEVGGACVNPSGTGNLVMDIPGTFTITSAGARSFAGSVSMDVDFVDQEGEPIIDGVVDCTVQASLTGAGG